MNRSATAWEVGFPSWGLAIKPPLQPGSRRRNTVSVIWNRRSTEKASVEEARVGTRLNAIYLTTYATTSRRRDELWQAFNEVWPSAGRVPEQKRHYGQVAEIILIAVNFI